MNMKDIQQLAKNRAKTATKGTMQPIGNLSDGKKPKYTPEEQAARDRHVARHALAEDAKNRLNLGYDDEGDIFYP